MAKIFTKQDSKFWQADLRIGGKRKKKSMKLLKSEPESKALEMAEAIEKAAKLKKAGALSVERMEKLVTETVVLAGGGSDIPVVQDFAEDFFKEKALGVKPNTMHSVRSSVKLFLEALGKKAGASLSEITRTDVEAWRDKLAQEGIREGTMETYFRKNRELFDLAIERGWIIKNPFDKVTIPKSDKVEAVPVYQDSVVKLIRETRWAEWKTILRWGYYHGLRIGDCCTMRWEYVDFDKGLISFIPAKQRKGSEARLTIPLHPGMQTHLLKQEVEARSGYITPKTAQNYLRARHTPVNLSNRLFKAAGVKGSFHGLRHGFVSTLANAGVSKDLRMVLTHHKTTDIHGVYTHFSVKQLRDALAKIPRIPTA